MEYSLYILLGVIIVASLWFLVFIVNIIFQAIFGYCVPYVPTPDYKIKKLLQSIKLQKGQKFLDIGCGDGRILEAVKKKFPESNCTGIENSIYPYYLAQKRKQKTGLEYEVIRGNFFKIDISNYNIIYCYLLPLHMKRVWNKVSSDCNSGTLLYSSAFEIPNKNPKAKIHIEDEKYFYLYEV